MVVGYKDDYLLHDALIGCWMHCTKKCLSTSLYFFEYTWFYFCFHARNRVYDINIRRNWDYTWEEDSEVGNVGFGRGVIMHPFPIGCPFPLPWMYMIHLGNESLNKWIKKSRKGWINHLQAALEMMTPTLLPLSSSCGSWYSSTSQDRHDEFS